MPRPPGRPPGRPASRPAAPTRRTFFALLPGAVVLAGGCRRDSSAGWADIPPSPGAEAYEGETITTVLDTRLRSRLQERGLGLLGSRLEALPEGVAWAEHQAFRDQHAAGLARTRDLVPEPDAPVLMAEYRGRERTLFVVARATDDGTRLVVLTALAGG